VESDPTRVCELLVGLPDVNVLGVEDDPGVPLQVHVESRVEGPWASPLSAEVVLYAASASPSRYFSNVSGSYSAGERIPFGLVACLCQPVGIMAWRLKVEWSRGGIQSGRGVVGEAGDPTRWPCRPIA
jgi:hypothetical protein